MIKRIAMIKAGLVENVVLVDDESDWAAPDYLLVDVELEPNVGPGFTYVDGAFLAPLQPPEQAPPPVVAGEAALELVLNALIEGGLITEEQKQAMLAQL